MSQMTISILDADRAIHAQPHGSFVDTLIPALSDDPESIEELQHAMRRFLSPTDDLDPLAHWSGGVSDEPYDAGVCIVDLAARLIVFQSTYCDVMRRGRITFDNLEDRKARWIPYSISDEWLVTDWLDGWEAHADELKKKRLGRARCDTRAVLYGKLAEFVVNECFAARGGSTDANGTWTPPGGWEWPQLPERAKKKRILITDAIAEIHARWLMTARDDLGGQTPRQVLHAQRSEITQQLEDREMQWSYFRECPPPLWRESVAYRFSGYGIHENVVYYELVRHLLNECWDMVQDRTTQPQVTREMAIDRIGMIQQEWLHTPQHDYSGKSPAQVIESERLRVPMGVTGAEAMVDCDCPICQMMAESDQPSFWHLDSCNMDDDFPFALFEDTRDDWEAMRKEWDEQDREWEVDQSRRPAEDEREKVVRPDGTLNDGLSSSIWQRSFVRSQPRESATLTLFGLGCHLAELIESIRGSGGETLEITNSGRRKDDRGAAGSKATAPSIDDTQSWIDRLNRDFANLRQAIADPAAALVAPVAAKFTEHLLSLAETRQSLRAKCLDLDRQLFEFVQRIRGDAETQDDVPY